MAGFESSLERDWLRVLDFNPQVRAIREQPFTIYYDSNDGRRRYTPDVLVELHEAGGVRTFVYEVKTLEQLRAEWYELRPRFKAAVAHCKRQGWQFKIVTETHIRTPLLANINFLRRYRSMEPLLVRQAQLKYTASVLGPTTPQALLAAAYWSVEDQATAIPALWQLVEKGELIADLNKPLTMSTAIRLGT
ncbi:TnsA endonuclease N-terminal domain-containing protein [Stenotrophomonas maltophilia]|uniref:TnsA endonuclease N-terminal domain-containing protein n=1 Tax=Stenotrophomonas maltophilia TaxID=40324 RepID=UPI002A6247D4|nr:TnsA endonuclease N-terminal domain-containing protein [Stenotrophomonas maltophilia]